MEDYTSANMADNITQYSDSNDRNKLLTSLQVLPGQSNYSVLVDSSLYAAPSYDVARQSHNESDKKQGYDTVKQFYLGALTVIGLLIVYRLTYRK
jgi:hypothetical protein